MRDIELLGVIERAQKAQERASIQALIVAKKGRIRMADQTLTSTLDELSEAMSHQTQNTLPGALKGALQGKAADAAEKYVTQIKKPDFKSPVKGG